MALGDFLQDYKLDGERLEIKEYPAKVLLQKAKPVVEFDEDLALLCKNMLYTMYKAPGIGLAAPQVGVGVRLFVMDIDYKREEVTNADGDSEYRLSDFNPHIYINPEIIEGEGEITYEEGCLSLPGVFEEVKRKEKVKIKYQNLDGEWQEEELDELFAVCFQHEFDHLEGVVFIDRLSLLKRNLYKKKFIKKAKRR